MECVEEFSAQSFQYAISNPYLEFGCTEFLTFYGHLNLEGDDMLEKLSASHVLAVDQCNDATMQRAE